MANWTILKEAIVSVIKTNGNQEITGAILQNTLNSIVNSIGENAAFAGIATPTTNPGTPDGPVFYIAGIPGVYSNFNGYELKRGIVAFVSNSNNEFGAVVLTSYDELAQQFLADRSLSGIPNIHSNHLVSISTDNSVAYQESSTYDAAWVLLSKDEGTLEISGVTHSYICFFSGLEPTQENSILNNLTGAIPSGAKLAIINLKKEKNPDGYDNMRVKYPGMYVSSLENEEGNKLSARQVYIHPDHVVYYNGNNVTYQKSSIYDCAWISLFDNAIKLEISGVTHSLIGFFSELEPVQENYLGANNTGIIPSGAKLAIVNFKKEENPNGYENIYVKQIQNFIDKLSAGNYLRNIPTGKNYINANDLLYGYSLQSGQIIVNSGGILSNKLYLEHGVTYTMQGIVFYGLAHAIFIAYYDKDDNYLGRGSYPATYNEGDTCGKSTFTFDNPTGKICYCRINLQNSPSIPFKSDIAQLEVGEEATDVEAYTGEEKLVFSSLENEEGKRAVRILSIGNSYSQDALSYIPFILPNIQSNIKVEIGILYLSGATLQQHYNNFVNKTDAYIYYLFNKDSVAWQTISSNYTIQQALQSQQWDIILLQQGSMSSFTWSTYQPYLNDLIDLIYNQISYPVKFGWMLIQSKPKNGGTVFNDEEILEHFRAIAENSQKVMDETLCEFIFPVGTAVQNARTTSLNDLGDYGKLCSSDGGHLQEGLPSQLAAYTCIIELLRLLGYGNKSIYGENTRVTSGWSSGKNIPGPNGSPVGSTDENCAIAQKCAIMAIKHPYVITDMTDIV